MNEACPITNFQINEYTARANAIITLIFIIFFFISYQPLIVLIMAIDFYLRGFSKPKFSFFCLLSNKILKITKLQPKMVNAGPKLFAAKIGFIFCVLIIVTYYANLDKLTAIFSIILAICAFLEGFLGYCVGCKFYTIYLKLFKRS